MTQIVTPYPGHPVNDSDDFDADPIRGQFTAIIQYLQAFPGDNIIAQSLVEAAFADAVNPRLRASEMFSNFVYTGGLSGGFSTLNYTVPTGTAYTTGYRHPITAQSFTATINKDTYVYVSKTGVVAVLEVVNGGSQPSLPADSQWLQKVVSNGTTITAITDLRNLIPIADTSITAKKLKGLKMLGGTSGSTFDYANTTIQLQGDSTVLTFSGSLASFSFSTAFPTACLFAMASDGDTNAGGLKTFGIRTMSTTGLTVQSSTASGGQRFNWIAVGY